MEIILVFAAVIGCMVFLTRSHGKKRTIVDNITLSTEHLKRESSSEQNVETGHNIVHHENCSDILERNCAINRFVTCLKELKEQKELIENEDMDVECLVDSDWEANRKNKLQDKTTTFLLQEHFIEEIMEESERVTDEVENNSSTIERSNAIKNFIVCLKHLEAQKVSVEEVKDKVLTEIILEAKGGNENQYEAIVIPPKEHCEKDIKNIRSTEKDKSLSKFEPLVMEGKRWVNCPVKEDSQSSAVMPIVKLINGMYVMRFNFQADIQEYIHSLNAAGREKLYYDEPNTNISRFKKTESEYAEKIKIIAERQTNLDEYSKEFLHFMRDGRSGDLRAIDDLYNMSNDFGSGYSVWLQLLNRG